MGRRQQGFSLIEMLLVVVLLGVLIPAFLGAFTAGYLTVRESRMLEIAKHVAQLTMEDALASPSVSAFGPVPFADYPNFTRQVLAEQSFVDGTMTITVVVTYPFLTGVRQHQMVAVRYGQ